MLNGATLKEQRWGQKEGYGALCPLPGLIHMEGTASVSNSEGNTRAQVFCNHQIMNINDLYVLTFGYSQLLDTNEVTCMVLPQRHCLVH